MMNPTRADWGKGTRLFDDMTVEDGAFLADFFVQQRWAGR